MSVETEIKFKCPKCGHGETVDVAKHVPELASLDLSAMAARVRAVCERHIERLIPQTFRRVAIIKMRDALRDDKVAAALGQETIRMLMAPDET